MEYVTTTQPLDFNIIFVLEILTTSILKKYHSTKVQNSKIYPEHGSIRVYGSSDQEARMLNTEICGSNLKGMGCHSKNNNYIL